jgi:hypothetical protein
MRPVTEAEKELGTLMRVEQLPGGQTLEFYSGGTVIDLDSWFRRYQRELRRIRKAERTRWDYVVLANHVLYYTVVSAFWFLVLSAVVIALLGSV